MARRPRRIEQPIGTTLPPDWRKTLSGWKIWAMLASIPDVAYEVEARAFERANVDVVSTDWLKAWKDYCDTRLPVYRPRPKPAPRKGLFSD